MIGKKISHYEILEKLGEGGMGVVYRARDTRLDRDVALKFLPPALHTGPEEHERFEREAKAISALNHPGIAIIHDIGEWNDHRFIVLEYIAGGTLKSKLGGLKSEGRQLSISEVLDYGIQIAEALEHAHRQGIVHRDVKTENMMLTAEGRVKLTDFGVAKLRGDVNVTSAGSTIGTAAYMSPEQVRAEAVDQRSDIFSFGIVLYELATMQLPFRGSYEAAVNFSILNETPPPVAPLRPDVPEGLQRILSRCLEKDPAKRFQDMGEVVRELRRLRHVPSGTPPAVKKRFRIPRHALAVLAGIAAILALVVIFWPSHPAESNARTIAVLPFTNLAGDKEEEYFSDGITEDVLMQLAKIADLNVISRTSVMQYKGTTKSIREIGRELNAGVILEGSVRHAGDKVRIVAQLINATDDRHLWAETYDREYKEILAIQSEIARNIAVALKARLSPVEVEHLNASHEANTAAYGLFLHGRQFANRRDGPNTVTAVEFYQRALEADSTDPRIWAALSDAHTQLAMLAWDNMDERVARAREAALKAIGLDANSAEGHRALALILHLFDWDWQGADGEFKKALALEPGNASTIYQLAYLSATLGRFEESIALAQKAAALDPILDRNYFALAFLYRYVNRNRESIALCRKTLELTPQYPCAQFTIAMDHLALGNADSAIAEARKEETEVWRLPALATAYFAAGKQKEADQALAELVGKYRTGAPFQIAEVYGFRGQADSAFAWLDAAYRYRDSGVSQTINDPSFRNIERDPRFAAFLKKLKLVD